MKAVGTSRPAVCHDIRQLLSQGWIKLVSDGRMRGEKNVVVEFCFDDKPTEESPLNSYGWAVKL